LCILVGWDGCFVPGFNLNSCILVLSFREVGTGIIHTRERDGTRWLKLWWSSTWTFGVVERERRSKDMCPMWLFYFIFKYCLMFAPLWLFSFGMVGAAAEAMSASVKTNYFDPANITYLEVGESKKVQVRQGYTYIIPPLVRVLTLLVCKG
jgi:hypothetical protein